MKQLKKGAPTGAKTPSLKMWVALLAILIGGNLSPVTGNAKAAAPAPESIVIEDHIMVVTPDAYMNALSVSIVLLDVNGNVQASATTTPGRAVTFQLNDGSSKVRSTYNMGAQGYIVIEDNVMQQ